MNAKGDVRLRSVLSIWISGICEQPREYPPFGKRRKIGVAAVLEHVEVAASWLGEDGDYCRRRLVGSETVSVGGARDGCFQKAVEAVDAAMTLTTKCDELQIVFRSFSGEKSMAPRSVPRLSCCACRTVDALNGFSWKSTRKLWRGPPRSSPT